MYDEDIYKVRLERYESHYQLCLFYPKGMYSRPLAQVFEVTKTSLIEYEHSYSPEDIKGTITHITNLIGRDFEIVDKRVSQV